MHKHEHQHTQQEIKCFFTSSSVLWWSSLLYLLLLVSFVFFFFFVVVFGLAIQTHPHPHSHTHSVANTTTGLISMSNGELQNIMEIYRSFIMTFLFTTLFALQFTFFRQKKNIFCFDNFVSYTFGAFVCCGSRHCRRRSLSVCVSATWTKPKIYDYYHGCFESKTHSQRAILSEYTICFNAKHTHSSTHQWHICTQTIQIRKLTRFTRSQLKNLK